MVLPEIVADSFGGIREFERKLERTRTGLICFPAWLEATKTMPAPQRARKLRRTQSLRLSRETWGAEFFISYLSFKVSKAGAVLSATGHGEFLLILYVNVSLKVKMACTII